MGTHRIGLIENFSKGINMTGFRWFPKFFAYFKSLCVERNLSLSIGRVKCAIGPDNSFQVVLEAGTG